jgi:DNA helicase-2/ATP-dependent DNA helicase PcrA
MGDFGTEIRGGLTRLGETESAGFTAPRSGWTRRLAPVIDVEVRPAPSGARGNYTDGARIFHQKFGYGTVIAADGDKLDIEFDKAGSKKVLASFVVPADRAR